MTAAAIPPASVHAAIPAPEGVAVAAAALQKARRDRAGIDRAVTVARISGWSLAVFAGFTALGAVLSAGPGFPIASVLLAASLAGLATLEHRGAQALRRLEPEAPGRLARNQLLIGGLIVLWCSFQAFAASRGDGPYADALREHPELGPILGDLGGVVRTVTLAGHVLTGLLGLGLQLIAWRFHLRRESMLERFASETPSWAHHPNGEPSRPRPFGASRRSGPEKVPGC